MERNDIGFQSPKVFGNCETHKITDTRHYKVTWSKCIMCNALDAITAAHRFTVSEWEQETSGC